MRSKQLFVGLGAVVLLVSACGSDNKASDTTKAATTVAGASTTAGGGSTPAGGTVDCKPVKAGVLSVVTSLPGPNFWGTTEADPSQIKTGLEYDMANDIAEKCGLKMEFRNESFDAIVAGQIPTGSYDIALSQVTITPDRAKVVDFSSGYFKADQGILVKKGTTVSSWDDLKKMTIGVQASTTAEEYLMGTRGDGKYKIDDVKSFPDLTSAYEALSSGQVGAVIIDTPINLGQAAQSGGELEVVAQFKSGDEYGAIFPKDSDRKAIFDPIVETMVDDGTITALTLKYFKGDPASVPFIEPS
ncbi:MAG: ABC transporter substrate-binding protein [Ilumatobacteraceae bacterium]